MSFEGYSGDDETVMSGTMSPGMTTPTSTAFERYAKTFAYHAMAEFFHSRMRKTHEAFCTPRHSHPKTLAEQEPLHANFTEDKDWNIAAEKLMRGAGTNMSAMPSEPRNVRDFRYHLQREFGDYATKSAASLVTAEEAEKWQCESIDKTSKTPTLSHAGWRPLRPI